MTADEPMTANSDLHAVVGTGPVGSAVIDALLARGLPVRAVGRRALRDPKPGIELVEADVTNHDDARRALAGASVVYHAASAPYAHWPKLLPPLMRGIIAGASSAGARLVYADNLYAYGPVDGPLTEELPWRASGPNGRTRAEMATVLMRADAAGTVRAAIGRASDYYGPLGRVSSVGDRLFLRVVSGQSAQLLGNPDMPHTYTYLADLATGLVTLGTNDAAFGQVWHLPSAETMTPRQFVHKVFEIAGKPERLSVTPAFLVAIAALFDPTVRAVREQRFQVERPWVVDHSKFANAFGAQTTPHDDAIRHTLAWFDGIAE